MLAQFSHVPRDVALRQITFQQRLDKIPGAGDGSAGGHGEEEQSQRVRIAVRGRVTPGFGEETGREKLGKAS